MKKLLAALLSCIAIVMLPGCWGSGCCKKECKPRCEEKESCSSTSYNEEENIEMGTVKQVTRKKSETPMKKTVMSQQKTQPTKKMVTSSEHVM